MYSSSFYSRSLEGTCGNARVPVMEQHQLLSSAAYQQVQQQQLGEVVLVDHSRSPMPSPKSSSNITVANSAHPHLVGGFSQNGFPLEVSAPAATGVDVRGHSVLGVHVENWGDSGMVATSPLTETSTDVDTDEKNRLSGGGHFEAAASVDSYDGSKEKNGDIKILRRLTQNREAARRSRLRKKAYVQQLESSRLKLLQLEQELQRARQQGVFFSGGHATEYGHSMGGSGNVAFDLEYARWLEEQQRQIDELRSAVNSNASDNELRLHVDSVMGHYDEVFRLKNIATKSDVFHMLSGMWVTPAERCFMWLGGFRSSELPKILAGHVEPLTDQQLMGICNLQQSSQQAEDALSQGMEALQLSLTDTLASGSLHPSPSFDSVTGYMNLMANAMAKLGTLENFLRQADLLRQQTLQQMHRILTTRQAARALLAINDYFARLRALSSLWLARPRD